jgi:hypothetical protein
VYKTQVVTAIPVFRALLPKLSRNSGVQVHLQIWKVLPLDESQGHCNQAAGHVFPGKGRGPPFPGWNAISQTKPQIFRINNLLVPKTDTQETENLDKAIFS